MPSHSYRNRAIDSAEVYTSLMQKNGYSVKCLFEERENDANFVSFECWRNNATATFCL